MSIVVRDKNMVIFGNVNSYNEKMAYIAHWINDQVAIKIAEECDGAGLERKKGKHPDQLFWEQSKLLTSLSEKAYIVTDCKLFPCSFNTLGCAYQVPILMRDAGIKVGTKVIVYCHADCSPLGKYCYETKVGANFKETEGFLNNVKAWRWKD